MPFAEDLVAKVALIGLLGIGAQWLAWRHDLPAIVLMAVAGLVAGPLTGLLEPAADFGDLLRPMIAVAVAIILFEGGLSLNLRELRSTSAAVQRLVLLGIPLGWALNAAAAHWIAGLALPVAVLFGGILVVTGPTVILPLLRQARLSQRPATVLKWEGIINDPLGALLAVFVFEYLAHAAAGQSVLEALLWLAGASVLAAALGIAAGVLVVQAFRRGLVPEFLKAPLIMAVILICYAAANAAAEESGLLAVTVLGVTIANARLSSLTEMRRFKESIAVLLVSGIFVILTATLDAATLEALDWRAGLFVAAVLFVTRPLTVLLSTPGTPLTWRERLLVAWIAPRGIVAVAVSGFFGAALADLGYADAGRLVPLAFALVFATVVAHGFSITWLARRLGLASDRAPGVLLVGASPWSLALAKELRDMEVEVTIADRLWHRLKPARLEGVAFYYGEILSAVTEHRLDLNRFGALIAATENDAYNALICTDFGPQIGRTRVFQLGTPSDDAAEDPHQLAHTLGGKRLFASGAGYDELQSRLRRGWTFQKTTLSEEYDFDRYLADRPERTEILLCRKPDGRLTFATQSSRPEPEAGDTLLSFVPGERTRGADV